MVTSKAIERVIHRRWVFQCHDHVKIWSRTAPANFVSKKRHLVNPVFFRMAFGWHARPPDASSEVLSCDSNFIIGDLEYDAQKPMAPYGASKMGCMDGSMDGSMDR